jgi:transposase
MKKQKQSVSFSLVHPHACGIDVGSRSHWVCIGEGEGQVREFKAFTEDLHELCRWLCSNGVRTVSMESTGFYWKQLFLMLQSYGLEAVLVNAAQTKHAGGRKSDLSDCQWLWRLHSAGLLTGSFQPDSFTEELRTYNRHRKSLIEDASRYIAKLQKALVMMNLQLPLVLTDIRVAVIKATSSINCMAVPPNSVS